MQQRTVLALARLAESCFSYDLLTGHMERVDWFADFLFEEELPTMAVGFARALPPARGAIKGFVVQLWELPSGAGFVGAGQDEKTARDVAFLKLASALLGRAALPHSETLVRVDERLTAKAVAALEMDGYAWQGGRLVQREESAFDLQEASGAIGTAYARAGIGDLVHVQKELSDIDDHYIARKWGDSIKHARDLLEMTLFNVGAACAERSAQSPPASWKKRPVEVRDFLRDQKFLDEKEHAFTSALYALLSEQGGHPNMSQQENARICRQYALSAVQFLLLRHEKLATE